MRWLVAIPVFNEEKYVRTVLSRVLERAPDVLVIDDGSRDATPAIVSEFAVHRIRREGNVGYGRSMRDAFTYAIAHGYDWLITMDCDEQHEPEAIPSFVSAAEADDADVVSGSRYLWSISGDDQPPADRRAINAEITDEVNQRLGLHLTDGFCGFKAYRVASLRRLHVSEDGYAFPMQFWVQAAAHGLRIRELPVRLIYNDPSRTFGGPLDDPTHRLRHYRNVLHCELKRCAALLPPEAIEGACCRCPNGVA
ncbi:MAG: glycosyltransferase family 2 protein [Phycisphaeraceae bacterium]|nr:glycosyltransferase family 2 protein [Phycisphaeraceae bacterium]